MSREYMHYLKYKRKYLIAKYGGAPDHITKKENSDLVNMMKTTSTDIRDTCTFAARKQHINKSKKCWVCGKPNGLNLQVCNGCSNPFTTSIDKSTPIPDQFDTESRRSEFNGQYMEVETGNALTAMIKGFEDYPAPYSSRFGGMQMSLRGYDNNVLVIDDALKMNLVHFLAIPRDTYVPDWRYLMLDPEQGIDLLNRLKTNAINAFNKHFWTNIQWRKKNNLASVKSLPGVDMTAEKFANKYSVFAFNYAPSEYQLHMQCMIGPMLPNEYMKLQKGIHHVKNRFYSFEYIMKVLHKMHVMHKPLSVIDDCSLSIANYLVDYSEQYDIDIKRANDINKESIFIDRLKQIYNIQQEEIKTNPQIIKTNFSSYDMNNLTYLPQEAIQYKVCEMIPTFPLPPLSQLSQRLPPAKPLKDFIVKSTNS